MTSLSWQSDKLFDDENNSNIQIGFRSLLRTQLQTYKSLGGELIEDS